MDKDSFNIEYSERVLVIQQWTLTYYSRVLGKEVSTVYPSKTEMILAAERLGLPIDQFDWDTLKKE